jgi:hypothetical protein
MRSTAVCGANWHCRPDRLACDRNPDYVVRCREQTAWATARPFLFCCLSSIGLSRRERRTSVALFRGDALYRGAECCVCVMKKQVTFKCGVIKLEGLAGRLLRIELAVNKSVHIWMSAVWRHLNVILLNIANWYNSSRTEQTEFSQWNCTNYTNCHPYLNILSQFTAILNDTALTDWICENWP